MTDGVVDREVRVLGGRGLMEPPRVCAMLGALDQQAGPPVEALGELRASLNPFSRFEFGTLAALEYTRDWQAK